MVARRVAVVVEAPTVAAEVAEAVEVATEVGTGLAVATVAHRVLKIRIDLYLKRETKLVHVHV